MTMASVRTTFTLEESLLERAREMQINVSAAARDGVVEAVRQAMIAIDIAAYQRMPEDPDPVWMKLQRWVD